MNKKIILTTPPEKWEHFLPLGNGRLGAMVKTHPGLEVLQLNEEGIWSGGPQNRLNPDTKKYLKKIRFLLQEGKVKKAQELALQTMSGTSYNQRVYQTAGEFKIDFFQNPQEGIKHGWPLAHEYDENCLKTYKAELELGTAVTTVTYKDNKGVLYTRKTWISAAHDMIFMYVTADCKGSINFSAVLDRGIWSDNSLTKNDFIFLQDSHGIPFTVGAGVTALNSVRKSQCQTRGVTLTGENCDAALFYIDIRTWQHPGKVISLKDYKKSCLKDTWTKECENNLQKTRDFISRLGVQKAYEVLLQEHLQEYEPYWKDFSINIGSTLETSEKYNLPAATLLSTAAPHNVELVNTYAAFSRYLLIAGSRKPGRMPLNLQGIWNCYMDPPWGSKYTININAQMNYWPCEMSGLSDCHLLLINLLARSYENGLNAAKHLYGCRGYMLHHNTDFWGDAAPQDAWIAGTYWVLGAAWLATHIWNHFEYTEDISFLKENYYLMHEACLFFVDFLTESDNKEKASDGKPYLVVNPSVSPENTYITKTGENGTMCDGCQMDNLILEHLFTVCLKARNILGEECKNKKQKLYSSKDEENFIYVLNHLKKPALNPDGSLMEWNQIMEEVEKGHRHISHLYGLFPGISIDVEKQKDLALACKKTLENRLSNGGGHTGWSQAWIINFYAQLGMGNEALESIVKLFRNSTLPNLLDNHPPFQIDGNFGALAGIIRLLVQSRIEEDGKIRIILLPSLPDEKNWQCGSVRGVCAKGGITLDFEWKDGKIISLKARKGEKNLPEPKLTARKEGGYICYF